MNSTLTLPPGTWTLDTTATTVTIGAKHLLAFTVPATLSVLSGAIEIEDGQVVGVDVVADASSYSSRNAKRNEHIVGSDFLDAQRHPTIGFRAAAVEPSSVGATVVGSVVVKGRTSPVSVAVSDIAVDGDTATFRASATVDRNDLGIDKMPSLVVGAHLALVVAAVATRVD